jgi:hypothetical protein
MRNSAIVIPESINQKPCAASPIVRLGPKSKAQKLAIVCQQDGTPERGATLVAGVAGPPPHGESASIWIASTTPRNGSKRALSFDADVPR